MVTENDYAALQQDREDLLYCVKRAAEEDLFSAAELDAISAVSLAVVEYVERAFQVPMTGDVAGGIDCILREKVLPLLSSRACRIVLEMEGRS